MMLEIGKSGKIICLKDVPDDKPAPFVDDTATYTNGKWHYDNEAVVYPDTSKFTSMKASDLQAYIMSLISPKPGTYTKKVSKKVSVLIPSYNKIGYVTRAIMSCVKQTVSPYEVVVLDMEDKDIKFDNSKVRIIKHDKLNAAAARNKLVELCNTEYFIFLDADDMLEDNFIETVINQDSSVVGVATTVIDDCNTIKDDTGYKGFHKRPFQAACFNLTGLLCKEAFYSVGGLKEELASGGEDSYFWCELFANQKWKITFTDDTHLYYRVCPGQISKKKEFYKSKELELYMHYDLYMKWLKEKNDEPDWGIWAESWKSFALRLLRMFGTIYCFQSEDIMQIPYRIKDETQVFKYAQLKSWYDKACPLYLKSKKRPTLCVCNDIKKPRLYGRAFDIAINDYLKPDLTYEDAVILNSNIDLRKDILEIMAEYNVVFLKSHKDAFNFIDCYDSDEDIMLSEGGYTEGAKLF